MRAFDVLTRFTRPPQLGNGLLKVHSHPRSGTHFAMAFIGRNFYPDRQLSIPSMEWGHWSNRLVRQPGNPFGQLVGSHKFPRRRHFTANDPVVYIFRDGRAVLLSFFKTANFEHRETNKSCFAEFLRERIDWQGTPGKRATPKRNLIQHWHEHVKAWHRQQHRHNLLILRYEDLVADPLRVANQLERKFFPDAAVRRGRPLQFDDIDPVRERIGLKPNAARTDAWKEIFSPDDLEYFHRFVPEESPFLVR